MLGTTVVVSNGNPVTYIDGSCAVYCISLSFRGPQMNRCRLIDKVSVYLQDRSNFISLQIVLIYAFKNISTSVKNNYLPCSRPNK